MPLAIGIDISDDYVTAYSMDGKALIEVPAVICREKKDDLWYIGETAYRVALSGKGVLTDKLLSLLRKKGTSTIARKAYTAEELLSRMIKSVLWQLTGGKLPYDGALPGDAANDDAAVGNVVISLRTAEGDIMDGVAAAARQAGIPGKSLTVISRSEAFVHYVLSQDKELYSNMCGLFDLSDESLSFYRLKVVRGISRNSVVVESQDLEENFRIAILKKESGSELADRIMTDAARKCLAGDIYSSALLTGRGFERTEWASGFISFICAKRRVIYEKGLFAIGAATLADAKNKNEESKYLIFCDTRVAAELSVQVTVGERNAKLVLIQAGQPWYGASAYAEVLQHGQSWVDIDLDPVDRFSRKRSFRISTKSFPERPDRCTRVSLELSMPDARTVNVRIMDLGLGELYPASDNVIEEKIVI